MYRRAHFVDDVGLNPDTGEGGRDNFDVSLGDGVREDLLDRVGLGQGLGLGHKAGGGDGERQGLSLGDVESISLHIGLGHGVEDGGRDSLSSRSGPRQLSPNTWNPPECK